MQKTRRTILEFLKQRGRATLEELAGEARVASMSARGHLSVLERDGLVTYDEVRGKVGRPRFVYSLTDLGQDQFPKSYHVLCNRVLEAATTSSADAASELASRIAQAWADDHRGRVAGQSFAEKVRTLGAIRTEEGAMASVEPTEDGFLLVQHHCPASCVAARFPHVICTAEMGYIRRLLDATVERVTWAQNGDGTCSYRIRPSKPDIRTLQSDSDCQCRPAPAD